jgi:hypothetical protein
MLKLTLSRLLPGHPPAYVKVLTNLEYADTPIGTGDVSFAVLLRTIEDTKGTRNLHGS